MATKKRSSRKKSTRSSNMKSFRVSKDTIPFTSTRFTTQTFYWIVLLAFIFILQLWIIKLQTDIGDLTNSITTIRLEK